MAIRSGFGFVIAWIALSCASLEIVHAQTPPAAPTDPDAMVQLNFPEPLQLKTLVEYISKRQSINFIYDDAVLAQNITIKTPNTVPASSLMPLLERVLKIKGLVMIETDVPGTFRIDRAPKLTSIADDLTTKDTGTERATQAIARVYELQNADPKLIAASIKDFLSDASGNVVAVPNTRVLIVTDFADRIEMVSKLIALADAPGFDAQVRFIRVLHVDAANLKDQVTSLMKGKLKVQQPDFGKVEEGFQILSDDRTNQVIVIATPQHMKDIEQMIATLDVPLGLKTKVYGLKNAGAEHVQELLIKLLGDTASERSLRTAIDPQSNSLIATTTDEIHEQIAELATALDKPRAEQQSPIRFYKLQYARAADVLNTLQSIEGDQGIDELAVDGVTTETTDSGGLVIQGPTDQTVNERGGVEELGQPTDVELPDARITADEASNTIIIIATPQVHPIYEKLIARLDQRRPQVFVEATIIQIDTSDDFELGVEIARNTDIGDGELITFSDFGVVNTDSDGGISLIPGIGFNGAMLSTNIADIIIKALKTDSRVRVVSQPRVLVNDNATGTLTSEEEEPYESVNASNTVATTSFGGFATAGTTITVTPQISEGDSLNLTYEITRSTFGTRISDTLPPSRQSNTLSSVATVPDGFTIIVGGLTNERLGNSVERVPFLGEIPIIEYLFSSRTEEESKSTLFVFLKVMILRDDKFEDLKIISGSAAGQADLAGDFPTSEPLVIR